MKSSLKISSILLLAVLSLGLCSCIEKNNQLGGSFIPSNQQYTIHVAEIPIEDIELQMADSLSGFSTSRMTFGSLRDETFGLTTRSCAFALIPIVDSIDFGRDPQFQFFFFTANPDTISFVNEDQSDIYQSVNVYELSEKIDFLDCNMDAQLKHGDKRITQNVPLYNGSDGLNFYFSKEFGEKYMTMTQEDIEDYDRFVEKFPGIYITTDEPLGEGGRINMFEAQLGHTSSDEYITGNYAQLNFSAYFDNATERKDTSILFYFGADNFYDVDSLYQYSGKGNYTQYIANLSTHESKKYVGKAEERLYVEGASGIKPVIPAEELREMVLGEISKYGDPGKTIINKATLVFPFKFPDDYDEMISYPQYLNPQTLIPFYYMDKEGTLMHKKQFEALADASSEYENQGEIDRANSKYCPDITFHTQSLLRMKDDADPHDYDVWLMIQAKEYITTTSGSNAEMSEFYKQMMYSAYYNSMYGGYSNYNTYGTYGYNNDYEYMLMAAMYQNMATSRTTTTMKVESDFHRFYNPYIYGPAAEDESLRPKLVLVFSVPND